MAAKVNVRVIAATNRELIEMVGDGTFRSDLYYRLNVFPLRVPPLRERNADIPRLARYFLGKFARKLGRALDDISAESMARLQRYYWPGNVRELQNIIERAAILTTGRIVEINDALISQRNAASVSSALGSLEEVERNHILQVLEACDWVIEGKHGAVMILALKPSTLRFRMQKYDISKSHRSR